jgi:hypothetical protein
MGLTMSSGQSFSITELGRRGPGEDEIRVVAYFPVEGRGERVYARRISALQIFGDTMRALLARISGDELFLRQVTGADEVIDEGLLAGAPLRIKGARRPLNITEVTEWEQIK